MANLSIKQGQSVSLVLTLDTAPSAPVYVGIYPNAVRSPRLLLSTSDGSLTQISETVFSAKVYSLGTLILDLIPVRRRSDNAECILDKLSGNFYTKNLYS